MIIFRYSKYRIFLVNEFWILIPLALIIDFFVIRKILSHKARVKEIEELMNEMERRRRVKKILLLIFGVGWASSTSLMSRGGELTDIVDSDYIRQMCSIKTGIGFLDDSRLRKFIKNFYSYKRRGEIIFVTASALCHMVTNRGRTFLDLPVIIGDFGLTSVYHTLRKTLATILIASAGPIFVLGSGLISWLFAFILCTVGFGLALNHLEYIAITPIAPTDIIKPRIPGYVDVVVLNNQNKVLPGSPLHPVGQECWLAEQRLLNPNCNVRSREMLNLPDSTVVNLSYEEIVNLRDVTGLHRNQFLDQFDVELVQSQLTSKSPSRKGKLVNFLEKFGDPSDISESDEWLTGDSGLIGQEGPEKIRTRDRPE